MPYGFPDDPDPKVRALSAHLSRLKGGRPMPSRADILPEDLPRQVLPDLFLIDVEGDEGPGHAGPWRYRFRLIGTHVAWAAGEDWTGRRVDAELLGPLAPKLVAAYDECVRARAPRMRHHLFENLRERIEYPARRYLFPLSSDGGRIDVLLGLFVIETGAWQT